MPVSILMHKEHVRRNFKQYGSIQYTGEISSSPEAYEISQRLFWWVSRFFYILEAVKRLSTLNGTKELQKQWMVLWSRRQEMM